MLPASNKSGWPPGVAAEDVRAQLGRILGSAGFVGSRRMRRFLQYVVDRTLENDADRLKEFSVALEVFDRDESYDPSIDSIVRVEARRLRTKLKAYYEGDGKRDAIRIELQPGKYVPEFRAVEMAPVRTADGVTVAVLPFVNMSPEPEQEYFCDGITEEILNALTTVEGLNVVARTSVFQFKGKHMDIREIGGQLGAQVVVEGSVRKAGDQLRITAQAIEAASGHHLWSETFRRRMEDVFAIQEEISIAVASVLQVKLRPRRTVAGLATPDLEAYTGFLHGAFLLHQQTVGSLHSALEQFRMLTERFPRYAPPYGGIAAALGFLSVFGVMSSREVLPEMRRNAAEAVLLDPESPFGWAALAGISAHWDYEWARAEEYYRRALALGPGHLPARSWFGMMLAAMGRLEEAKQQLEKAARLNPLGAADWARMGYVLYLSGDTAGTEAACEKAFRLEPDYSDAAYVCGVSRLTQGDDAGAAEVLSRAVSRLPLGINLGLLAAAYGRMGKTDEVETVLQRLNEKGKMQYMTPLALGLASVGMGRMDDAFAHLSQAIEERSARVGFLNVDPYFEPLKRDARFAGLLDQLRLNIL